MLILFFTPKIDACLPLILSHLVDLKQALLVTLLLIPHVFFLMLLIGLGVPTPEEKAQKIVLLYFDSFDWKYFDSFDWKQLGDFFWEDVGTTPSSKNKLFPFNEI